MYTFLEKCEEVTDLYLDDGTKKIFLNMESKNSREELVSLLQYMEKSSLENPKVIVKDPRILRLDEIVTEVKQSEEGETSFNPSFTGTSDLGSSTLILHLDFER